MVLSKPKLIIQAMSMNPRMSVRPQEDVKHSPDETDSVTDKEGSFILEPFTSNYRQPEFLLDYQLPPLSVPEQTPPNPNA